MTHETWLDDTPVVVEYSVYAATADYVDGPCGPEPGEPGGIEIDRVTCAGRDVALTPAQRVLVLDELAAMGEPVEGVT